MYTLYKDLVNQQINTVKRSDGMWIPLVKDNTDYQRFKEDLANGVALSDAEGNPMTGAALTTFMETLP